MEVYRLFSSFGSGLIHIRLVVGADFVYFLASYLFKNHIRMSLFFTSKTVAKELRSSAISVTAVIVSIIIVSRSVVRCIRAAFILSIAARISGKRLTINLLYLGGKGGQLVGYTFICVCLIGNKSW